MFLLKVEREIEAAHANGPPSSKCFNKHGHTWQIMVEVRMGEAELDEYGWTLDFSAIKKVIDQYDHQDLNEHPNFRCALTESAPVLPARRLPASAENLARVLFWDIVAATDKWPRRIIVHEGHGNSISYEAGADAKDPRLE